MAGFALETFAMLVALLLLRVRSTGGGDALDADALRTIRHVVDHRGTVWLGVREFMVAITAIGSLPIVTLTSLAAVGLLSTLGFGRLALRFAVSIACGVGAAELLKEIVARPRPEVVTHWGSVASWSFPSGHSTDAALTYPLLAAVVCRAAPGRAAAAFISAFAVLLVVLVGFSRLYLGVHWPTDVLGGWCLGSVLALLSARWILPAGGRTDARGAWLGRVGTRG